MVLLACVNAPLANEAPEVAVNCAVLACVNAPLANEAPEVAVAWAVLACVNAPLANEAPDCAAECAVLASVKAPLANEAALLAVTKAPLANEEDETIAVWTNAVVATIVLLLPAAAVGAIGIPDMFGEISSGPLCKTSEPVPVDVVVPEPPSATGIADERPETVPPVILVSSVDLFKDVNVTVFCDGSFVRPWTR